MIPTRASATTAIHSPYSARSCGEDPQPVADRPGNSECQARLRILPRYKDPVFQCRHLLLRAGLLPVRGKGSASIFFRSAGFVA